MKNLLYAIGTLLIIQWLMTQCANPKAPTGGPQDTIPPVLIETNPPVGSINVNPQEITLTFDEWITAEKLSQNLIITPTIDNKHKTLVKKNKFILKFEKPFPDSTTITLNFFDGITDIHEKKPAVNLSYVFSTGSFLDSLTISGQVKDLLTSKLLEKITVALYTVHDSLNIYKQKPTYFTSSNKQGTFRINNIKNATYKLVAFEDANRNLIFEPANERYGFLSEPLKLDSAINGINIPLIKVNADSLRITSSRANGNYYDVRISKPVITTSFDNELNAHILKDKTTIRIYQPKNYTLGDSIRTQFMATDSLNNSVSSTLFVKFNESIRKPEQLTVSHNLQTKKQSPIITNLQLKFNKPITSFDPNLISWQKDSTLNYAPDSLTTYQWNNMKDLLTIQTKFDTLQFFTDLQNLVKRDTVKQDTIALRDLKQGKATSNRSNPAANKKIALTFPKNTFISAQNDTLANYSVEFDFFKKNEVGTIILNLTGNIPPIEVQLIDKSYNVIKRYDYKPQIVMQQLNPADYGIRLLFDTNGDNTWNIGNIRKNIAPEPVYVYPDFTSLRANWEVTLNVKYSVEN